MSQRDINFLPASYIQKQERRQQIARQAGLIAVVAILLVGWWMVQRGQTAAMRRYADTLEQAVLAQRDQMKVYTVLEAEQRDLLHRVKVQRKLAQPIRHTQILATLTEVAPSSVAVTAMTIEHEQPRPSKSSSKSRGKRGGAKQSTAASGDLLRIAFTGIAPSDLVIANLLTALKSHGLFHDAKLHYARAAELDGIEGRQFQIEVIVPLDRQGVNVKQSEEVAYAD